ncbi:30S ribosome-binding factor RbfA [Dehalococcoidia bacterium]|nr:30S ribosome-binding factor RbfA [Dehalococcoidia bacterium]
MATRRANRVNELIREILSELILRQLKDPRHADIISITKVEASADFRSARVFISTLGDEAEKVETLQTLQRAAGFLRRELKSRVSLKTTPFLTFHRDDSIEKGALLLALMDEVGPPPNSASQ